MKDGNMLKRRCPLCDYANGELLYIQSFDMPKAYDLPCDYKVMACEQCGFVFEDMDATQQRYNRYYDRIGKYETSAKTVIDRHIANCDPRYEGILNNLEKYISPESEIIDVGCGAGYFLYYLKQNGYLNLTGMDASESCLHTVEQLGIHTLKGSITDTIKSDKKYNVILLSHVMEHIFDIRGTMKNLDKLLIDDGIIYVEVPNSTQYEKYFIAPYDYFNFEHINHFNYDSMRGQFAEYGYYPVKEYEKEVNVWAGFLSIAFKKWLGQSNGKQKKNKANKGNIEEVKSYIKKSKERLEELPIKEFVQNQEEIIIWGTGAYVLALLAKTDLSKCNIKGLIDMDVKKHGMNLQKSGHVISGAEILDGFKGTIVIGSVICKDHINFQINELGCKNKIVLLA